MIKACKYASKKKLSLITLTGFKKDNSVSKYGAVNIWVNSKTYNHVENTHQFQLLAVVELTDKKNKMKKIFVIGGAGYVGSKLVSTLLQKDYFVTVFDLMIYGNNLPKKIKI